MARKPCSAHSVQCSSMKHQTWEISDEASIDETTVDVVRNVFRDAGQTASALHPAVFDVSVRYERVSMTSMRITHRLTVDADSEGFAPILEAMHADDSWILVGESDVSLGDGSPA